MTRTKKKTDAQKAVAIAARMTSGTSPAASTPKGPRPIKASVILDEIRDERLHCREMFLARASRMAEELAGVIAHGYDVARVIQGGADTVEPQMRAAVLSAAISRLEGGAVKGHGETFADRLADVLDEADFELRGVIRSRPWESSSTCQVTNVTDRAKLSGRVAAHEYLKGRAGRFLDADRFTIEDDVTDVTDAVDVVDGGDVAGE